MGQKLAEAGYPDMSSAVRPMALSPDERFVYFQVSFFHGFVEYDFAQDKVTRVADLPISDEAEALPREELPARLGPPRHRDEPATARSSASPGRCPTTPRSSTRKTFALQDRRTTGDEAVLVDQQRRRQATATSRSAATTASR